MYKYVLCVMIAGMVATLLLYFGANTYIFIRLLQALSAAPVAVRVAFAILFWIAAVALFVALAMRGVEGCEWLHRTLFAVGSVWLVFILYMTLATVVTDLLSLILPAFKCGVWYALGATVLLLTYGYLNYRNPHTETIEIQSDKLQNCSLRVVAISDIHLGYGTTRKMLERYVERINSLQADVVLIVGDLIDNSVTPVRQASMGEVLSEIETTKGVYMVLGNHEYISGIDESLDYLRTTPIVVLCDSVTTLDSQVAIIGRDDRMNRRRKSLEELVAEVSDELFTIVLDH